MNMPSEPTNVVQLTPRKPITCPTKSIWCETREQQIATLVKAAIDAAVELDWLKNTQGITEDECTKARIIVERVFAAAEQVQS